MFTLSLYDRKGNKLNLGDLLEVSDGRSVSFFAQVTYLEKEQVIAPFHTFSFHSFEKVDQIPEGAVKSTEERYNIWYLSDPKEDRDAEKFEGYLMDWRQCEHLLNKRCYRIELNREAV